LNDQNPRQIAARILSQRLTSGEYTENLLETALAAARLSPADRGLCHELVCGVVRWQAALDRLIARKTDPARELRPALRNFLRLGLYQIFWLDRIPPHAAVHETVEQTKRAGYHSQAGLINAVLRSYLRELDEIKKILADMKVSAPALGWSHPEWLVEKWRQQFGEENLQRLLEWNNTPPKTYARVNLLKADVSQLIEKWREENVEYDFITRDWTGENLAFELKAHPQLTRLASFRAGWFYLQDPSTLLAPVLLGAQPGETILDACAAPGGKTMFIAQQMNNDGKIIACDLDPTRLRLVKDNCVRLGVKCVETKVSVPFLPHPDPLPKEREQQATASDSSPVIIANPAPKVATTRKQLLPLPAGKGRGEGEQFDRILIDAPCSNTGVMRRRVDLRWRVSEAEILRLRKTQLELLQQSAPKLKPGGVLVYSTCSLEPEENSGVVQQFLAAHPGFKLESERQLLPFADGVDGAYVARLLRI